MTERFRSRTPLPFTAVALLAAAYCTAGCDALKFIGYVLGGSEKPVTVTAAHRGLENRSFAVLVAPDEDTAFRHRNVAAKICRSVTTTIATVVDGTRPMDPNQIAEFLEDNPFWATAPPGDIVKRLEVDRVLIVWVEHYALHERGNAHIGRGVLTATLDVFEAEARDPNGAAYHTRIKAEFPRDSTVGLVNTSDRKIEQGLLRDFGQRVANLFVDHEEVR